jgi:hypothetical protein
MWKYIEYNLTNVPRTLEEANGKNDLPALRKKYPGMNFKAGKYKDKSVTFVLKDLTTKEYSDPIDSEEYPGVTFFAPKAIPTDIQVFLDEHKINKEIDERKILVTLPSGIKLVITPATLEPKKVLLSITKPSATIRGENFYGTTEYGLLAYKVYSEVKEKGGVDIGSEDCIKLISHALRKSYTLGIDMWNYLELIGTESLDPLLSAACGVGDEVILKKN